MSGFLDLFILVSVLGGARSGWKRGFVFRVIDIVGFVLAVIAAIKLHGPFRAIYDGIGFSPRVAPLLGGLTVFVPVIVAVGFLGRRLVKTGDLPGISLANKILGAAFGAALALVVMAVGLMAIRSFDLPFTGLAERSELAETIVEWSAPVVRGADSTLDLGLCEGRFAKRVEEVCTRYATERAEEETVQTRRTPPATGGPSPG